MIIPVGTMYGVTDLQGAHRTKIAIFQTRWDETQSRAPLFSALLNLDLLAIGTVNDLKCLM